MLGVLGVVVVEPLLERLLERLLEQLLGESLVFDFGREIEAEDI